VNTENYLGIPIDQNRIANYEDSLQGRFSGGYGDREKFFGNVAGLCHVKKQDIEERNITGLYTGSCMDFYKTLRCSHCAIFQYEKELPVHAYRLPQNKKGRYERRNKGAVLVRGAGQAQQITQDTLSQLTNDMLSQNSQE
jgi:hypothetical protein